MKIKPTHYHELAVKVNRLLDKNPGIKKAELLGSMRKRWDVYWASGGAFSNVVALGLIVYGLSLIPSLVGGFVVTAGVVVCCACCYQLGNV